MALLWQCRDRVLDCTAPRIMGILNVTPDSFTDGGRYFDPASAVAHALAMEADGVDIIDVGGESTRPGAKPVPVDEEIRRTAPVIRALRERTECLVSVDTAKAAVARAALDAGAHIVNDISAGADPAMAAAVKESGAGWVLMHMQGTPQTMQQDPHYADVAAEVAAFLRGRMAAFIRAGVAPEQLALDPGIGFGKKMEHNVELLRRIPDLAALGRPVLIGVSRKSFLGKIAGCADTAQRLPASLAALCFARQQGAHIFRVHDVRESRDALRTLSALAGQEPVACGSKIPRHAQVRQAARR